MVVYTTADSGFRETAATVAQHRSERVVTDLDGVGPDEEVVYVDRPDAIDEDVLFALQQRLEDGEPGSGRFSVVTGFTPEQAADFYHRENYGSGDHCVLARWPLDGHAPDDDLTVLARGDATVERLRDLQTDRLRSLSVVVPGKPFHLILEEGYVCGFAPDVSTDAFEGRLPKCIEDGEENCPFGDDLLPASEVDAAHVFVSSCTSMIDNHVAGLPVHVGVNLLRNATSVIGAYRPAAVDPPETLLHYAALRAGYDVVERCRYLNRNAHATDSKSYPFFPLGRPEASVPDPYEGQYEVAVRTDDDGVRLDLFDVDAYLVEVDVPREAVGDAENYYVRRVEGRDADLSLNYFVDDRGSELSVVLYAGGPIEASELSLRLTPEPARTQDRQALFDSLRNAERMQMLGLSDKKSTRQVENLRHEVPTLARLTSPEVHDVDAHVEFEEELDRILHEANLIGDTLTEYLVDQGIPHKDYGKQVVRVGAYPASRPCSACGNLVFVSEVDDVMGATKRAVGYCSRCGPVFDVPTTAGDPDPARPEVHSDLIGADTSPVTVKADFRNPLPHRMHGVVRYSVFNHSATLSRDRFDPERIEFALDPGEEMTFECTFDTEPLPENFYDLAIYLVGNNDVYTGMVPLNVGDRVGFMI